MSIGFCVFAPEMAMHNKIIRREITMDIDLKCPFLSVKEI
jgi:hypothetical protein